MHEHRTQRANTSFARTVAASELPVGMSLSPYKVPYSNAYNRLQTYGKAYARSLYNLLRGRVLAPPCRPPPYR